MLVSNPHDDTSVEYELTVEMNIEEETDGPSGTNLVVLAIWFISVIIANIVLMVLIVRPSR